MTNLKKDVIDKRLVNSVKYLCSSLRLVWSLFTCKKVWKQCKNKHKVQKKLSNVQTYTTDLASYSPSERNDRSDSWLWNGFLERALRIKTINIIPVFFFFFWFLFNYAIQGKSISWLVNSTLNCTWNRYRTNREGFRVQFNVEFPCQVMNFPIVLRKSRTRSRSRRRI